MLITLVGGIGIILGHVGISFATTGIARNAANPRRDSDWVNWIDGAYCERCGTPITETNLKMSEIDKLGAILEDMICDTVLCCDRCTYELLGKYYLEEAQRLE